MVDINNTKQADKKETREMGIRTNHSIANKPKYREVKRELCQYVYTQIKLLSNSTAEVEEMLQFGFMWFINTQEKKTFDCIL